jgi:hypothetical protein
MRSAIVIVLVACSSGSSTSDAGADAIADAGPLPPDPCVDAGTCPSGVWINVTPPDMSASVLSPTTNAFGPGAIVADPAHPSDLYIGAGADGVWKSTDYGSTWTRINSTIPGSPIGVPIAVAGTTPATIWINAATGDGAVFKSVNGGTSFDKMGGGQTADLYSIKVDPNDPTHLVSGLHEADGIVESTNGGTDWHSATSGSAGWPTGGISWFPFFVDTGDASTTRTTWLAIAQDGASVVKTIDGGAHWTVPQGIAGLQHPHGCSQMFQSGATIFAAGLYGPNGSQGVYRSTDRGDTWSLADTGKAPEAVVFGSTKNVYAMWGWACSDCNLGTSFETAVLPGSTWTQPSVPGDLVIGPNSVATTSDGTHTIFVATMWALGVWRYVEP